MGKQVCAQVAQLSCSKGALQLSAAVGLLASVYALVASEGSTVYCCVLTARLITFVRLFPSVLAPGVDYEGSPFCSGVTTALIVAVERLLACVRPVVCS